MVDPDSPAAARPYRYALPSMQALDKCVPPIPAPPFDGLPLSLGGGGAFVHLRDADVSESLHAPTMRLTTLWSSVGPFRSTYTSSGPFTMTSVTFVKDPSDRGRERA
jgi:hypothetical protein